MAKKQNSADAVKNSPVPIELVIKRAYEAPAERIFDAWLDADTVQRWLFATPEGEMTNVEIDPRIGGAFKVVERRGDTLAGHYGKYLEIERPRRLVFSYSTNVESYSSTVAIDIAPMAGGCELTLTHYIDPEWADYAERTRQGWTRILEGLDATIWSQEEYFLTRVFDAPREAVFDACTDPGKISQWWGPKEFSAPVGELDVRPGGAYRLTVHSPEGIAYSIKGKFLEVVPPERLVATLESSEYLAAWRNAMKGTRGETDAFGVILKSARFDEEQGKTRLTIRTRFRSADERNAVLRTGMGESWCENMDRLAAVLGDDS